MHGSTQITFIIESWKRGQRAWHNGFIFHSYMIDNNSQAKIFINFIDEINQSNKQTSNEIVRKQIIIND